MCNEKFKAYYELEVRLTEGSRGIHLVRELIKGVGTLHEDGSLDGVIYAIGFANFETPEKAYQWRLDAQDEIWEKYPEDYYAEEIPCVLCGLRFIYWGEKLYGELELDENGKLYIHVYSYSLKLNLDQFEIGDKSSLDDG